MRGLLFFSILLLFGWYTFSGYWYNCKIKNRCGVEADSKNIVEPAKKEEVKTVETSPIKAEPAKKEEVKKVEPTKKKTIEIGDAFMNNLTPLSVSGYQFKTGKPKGNIYFSTDSTATANPIINNSVAPYLKEISDHLKRNSLNKLQITGYYTSKEASIFKGKNLGLERANNVKGYLVKGGLNQNQVETKALQNNNLRVVNENVTGAINLSLKTIQKPAAKPIAKPVVKPITKPVVKPIVKPAIKVTKAIEQETKTVYFKYNSSEIIITNELQNYVERLKLYLKQNTGKKVVVTGHTDSFGNRQQNISLGLKRATFVKQFLAKSGVIETQIKVDSKGPDKPIASNKTTAGKDKNRRVEITFN